MSTIAIELIKFGVYDDLANFEYYDDLEYKLF